MDLNVGSHCSMKDCHQLDFLPYKCDYCQKKFCETHRLYKSHGCIGDAAKDATSLDCPICGKSVRFTKDESADLKWAQHYSSDCSKKPSASVVAASSSSASAKAQEKCPAPNCRTVLGISNALSCGKCGVKVCIVHRMPEDHVCKSLTSTSKKPVVDVVASSRPSAKIGGASSKKLKQPVVDPVNTLRGSAERRKVAMSSNWSCKACTSINSPGSGNCSVCGTERLSSFNDAIDLTSEEYSVPTSTSGANAAGGIECCPFCAAKYSDPVDLIVHVQDRHPDGRAQRETAARSTPSTGEKKCICS